MKIARYIITAMNKMEILKKGYSVEIKSVCWYRRKKNVIKKCDGYEISLSSWRIKLSSLEAGIFDRRLGR